jgi:hypothetical protein
MIAPTTRFYTWTFLLEASFQVKMFRGRNRQSVTSMRVSTRIGIFFNYYVWNGDKISLNRVLISNSLNTYGCRAYLKTLLGCGQPAKQSHPTAGTYYKDESGKRINQIPFSKRRMKGMATWSRERERERISLAGWRSPHNDRSSYFSKRVTCWTESQLELSCWRVKM